MTEDDDKHRRDLYDAHLKQTWQDIQASTDNYDKNLLTMSSAALGFSVAFLKDILPTGVTFKQAPWHSMLYISWLSFVACIVVVTFSFLLSVAALNKQLERLPRYYEEKDATVLKEKSTAEIVLRWFTWASATFFLAGIILTVAFCVRNVL